MILGQMRRARDDDGMTIIEVMMAAMILFFVLTAVLALIVATTRMGITARQRIVMTNATNAYVERIQSMDFENVDLLGVGEGTIPLEESVSIDGFVVRIVPEIAPGDNDALKNLHISIWVSPEGTNGNLTTMFRETTVVIRDRDEFLTRASRDPETDPTLEILEPPTPSAYTVVWDENYYMGALLISARATASEGRTIDSVSYTCEGQPLQNGSKQLAQWYPETPTWEMYSFVWDTLPENTEHDRMFFDGDRTVTVTVIDNDGAMITRSRHFIVDNDPPDDPTPPQGIAINSDGVKLTWTAPMDGNLPADHYALLLYKQPIWAVDDEAPSDPTDGWASPVYNDGNVDGTSLEWTATPFSRYWYMLQARSPAPRNLPSGWVGMPHPFVTRPVLTGTEEVTITRIGINYNAYVKNTLTLTPPTFPVESITYEWYRGLSTDSMVLVHSGTEPTFVHTYEKGLGKFGKTDPYYYQVKVTYVADGYGGGVTEPVVSSNFIGPTSVTQKDSIPTQPITGIMW